MERITTKMLEIRIDYLNELTDAPKEPYTKGEDGKLTANIGNHHLSFAYGGVCVHRTMNKGGGVDTPITYGHVPKRELFEKLVSFIAGIELGKKLK